MRDRRPASIDVAVSKGASHAIHQQFETVHRAALRRQIALEENLPIACGLVRPQTARGVLHEPLHTPLPPHLGVGILREMRRALAREGPQLLEGSIHNLADARSRGSVLYRFRFSNIPFLPSYVIRR